jgi:hypothetical protein
MCMSTLCVLRVSHNPCTTTSSSVFAITLVTKQLFGKFSIDLSVTNVVPHMSTLYQSNLLSSSLSTAALTTSLVDHCSSTYTVER